MQIHFCRVLPRSQRYSSKTCLMCTICTIESVRGSNGNMNISTLILLYRCLTDLRVPLNIFKRTKLWISLTNRRLTVVDLLLVKFASSVMYFQGENATNTCITEAYTCISFWGKKKQPWKNSSICCRCHDSSQESANTCTLYINSHLYMYWYGKLRKYLHGTMLHDFHTKADYTSTCTKGNQIFGSANELCQVIRNTNSAQFIGGSND